MDYAALRAKYSGQDVPEWELEKHGLKAKPEVPKVEAPTVDAPVDVSNVTPLEVRKTRRRKTEG